MNKTENKTAHYEHEFKPDSGLDRAAGLRYQERCCESCRFYRTHHTSAVVSECLLLGRTLGIASDCSESLLSDWARGRVCDSWERRPRKWVVRSAGIDANPHFADPYLSREALQKKRIALAKRLGVGLIRNYARRVAS